MFGLNLTPGEAATFVSSERAHIAVQRLAFIATEGFKARVSQVVRRGEMQGYYIKLAYHTISEVDVERFGL